MPFRRDPDNRLLGFGLDKETVIYTIRRPCAGYKSVNTRSKIVPIRVCPSLVVWPFVGILILKVSPCVKIWLTNVYSYIFIGCDLKSATLPQTSPDINLKWDFYHLAIKDCETTTTTVTSETTSSETSITTTTGSLHCPYNAMDLFVMLPNLRDKNNRILDSPAFIVEDAMHCAELCIFHETCVAYSYNPNQKSKTLIYIRN